MTAGSPAAPGFAKAVRSGRARSRIPRCAIVALLALFCAGHSPAGDAQEARPKSALLQQADAAYAAGDRERAKALYRAVLAAEPDNSRAVFQLARLSPPGSAEAVALLRRYVKLEPGDAWGTMALGDALAKSGAVDEALAQYALARRKAPGETDVYTGLGRILRDAGRSDELVAMCEDWVSRQPGNATAWFELARARQRAQRHAEAADAYARSLAIRADERTRERLDGALAESAPSFRVYGGHSADSDENRTLRAGLELDGKLTPRSRLGVHAEHARVSDPLSSGSADELALFGRWQPLAALRLDALAGTARLSPDQGSASNHALRRARLRWKSPSDGPALELRVVQNPLVATPGLIAEPVELTETKGTFELPLDGPWRARARGQSGRLDADATAARDRDVNHRTGYQLGPVYRVLPSAEINASYGELAYEHAAAVGYFAPKRVQTVEVGTYVEYEGLAPLAFALDAGVGRQHVEKFGVPSGGWTGTVRLWGLASWAVKPGVSLDLELEHYDSPVAGDAATPSADWRYNSVLLSLRFGVRRERTGGYRL